MQVWVENRGFKRVCQGGMVPHFSVIKCPHYNIGFRMSDRWSSQCGDSKFQVRLSFLWGWQESTNLIKHVSQVVLGINPGCHSVTEEDKVLEGRDTWHVALWEISNFQLDDLRVPPYLHHTCRVDADHHTDAAKGRVLLFIISYIPQRRAPEHRCDKNKGVSSIRSPLKHSWFLTHQGLMNCCSCGATSCGQT